MRVRPALLRELVERYERLSGQRADVLAEPRVRDLLRDTAYTLCVSTGTRDITSALAAARARIGESVDVSPAAGAAA